MSGIDTLIALRSEFPEARVIMLTTFEGDVEIHRALQAGARGYLLKNMPPSELLDVIRQVHAGAQCSLRHRAGSLHRHTTRFLRLPGRPYRAVDDSVTSAEGTVHVG